MKKITLLLVMLLCFVPMLQGCNLQGKTEITAESYFRIHIRANSNLQCDQVVKYAVKDAVVSFLTPKLANCSSKTEVISMVNTLSKEIKQVCETELQKTGYSYGVNIVIREEYFPTRVYGNYVLHSDFYDALIVELGEAKGDNWWCVVYPPLCFLNAKELDNSNIKYKSKLYELISNFFG